MRIAVLGLGGVGSAALRFAANAGHSAIGFEQYAIDHDRGSSYGGSRIIRKVYPDALYAGMMQAAYPLWRDLQSAAGEELIHLTGGLYFAAAGNDELRLTCAALTEVGQPFELLNDRELRERFPQFRLDRGSVALLDAESGYLRASKCVCANLRLALAGGATVRTGCPVLGLEPRAGRTVVTSSAGEESFDAVILTAGPWTGALLRPWLELPLRVTRQQYAHLIPRTRGEFSQGRFPVWIDLDEYYYGFPENDDAPGAKLALHVPGPEMDPNDADRTPREEAEQGLLAYARRRLPGLSDEVGHRKVCLYTMTPDSDFLVGRLPELPGVVYVGGLSGHGFKFTVLLGKLAAQLAFGENPGMDLARFDPGRFARD